ncbi:MAG: hypothetical protein KDE58_38600, partial [Caldilineaceae bacterium]|nr:hypothetical protein [Caldilineaceae bacterium]
LHGLLAHGFQIMTHYFPDLPTALTEGGALVNDMGEGMRWFCYGGYRRRVTFGHQGALMSRPFLEWLIRRRVLTLPNITLLDRCDVDEPIASLDNRAITGVAVIERAAGNRRRELAADLVVDAAGRVSAAPKWLEALGYTRPEESLVKVNVGYATRIYRRNPQEAGANDWIFITPDAPKEKRMGGAFPIEGDRWVVSVGGWSGDHGPTDEAAFLQFAKSLPAPDVYEVINNNEPLSDIVVHKFPASLRRHYETLSRFPEGYLVMGDAHCSFNPLYGQGMTSAAIQAQTLDRFLAERRGLLAGIAIPFFKQVAKAIDIPWQTAVGEDFRFPATEGKKAPGTNFINGYVARVHRASHHDDIVCKAFLDVMNLLKPPTSLFQPQILWRVLWRNRNAQTQRAQAGTTEMHYATRS